ncbi:MAG: tetratricopeptide repeat protein [Anaerolineae bacterium]
MLVGEDAIRNAEDLRRVLRQAELDVADLRRGGPDHALRLLHEVDAIEKAIPRLESEFGVDLKPERTRLQTVENTLNSKARLLVREAGAERLVQEREEVQATADEWWWHLDEIVAERRRWRLRRWAIRGIIVAVVLLLAAVAYQLFLAPSPEQQALTASLSEGESALLQGDLTTALQHYQAALAGSPNDPDIHLYVGAIYEQLGQNDKAAEHFNEASRLLKNPAAYHSALSLIYYRMATSGLDVLGKAEAEALAAVEADDQSAMAHFALASVYELQGKTPEAIDEFEKASQLSTDPSLTVLARMRMGMLMQRPAGPVPSATAAGS